MRIACEFHRCVSDLSRRDEVLPLDFSMPVLIVDDYQTMIRIVRNLL